MLAWVKTIYFIPLAYLADLQGFGLFTAYALVVLTAAHLFRRRPLAVALQAVAAPV